MPSFPSQRERRAAKLKYMLAVRGLSCAELDRRRGLYDGQCRKALYEPDEDGEQAIADALGEPPQTIWPERFDATGVRLLPQPRRNYRRREEASSRPNDEAA